MDIKTRILKKIVWIDDEIKYMVSHHILSYVGIIFVSSLILLILFFLYIFVSVFSMLLASYLVWILAIILYFYFVLNFFDVYLDAVIVTDTSIIIYKWYGLFKTTTDVLSLHAVESVYSDQTWLVDTIFNVWNLFIKTAKEETIFVNVWNPTSAAKKINAILANLHKEEEKEPEPESEDDFKVFVEAMAEVIKDYKARKE